MYFAIWWIGVRLATIYLNGAYSFKSIKTHCYVLAIIIGLLGLNLYLNFEYTKVYDYPLVAYPFINTKFCFAFFSAIFGYNLEPFQLVFIF
jgi:hypothetical protein